MKPLHVIIIALAISLVAGMIFVGVKAVAPSIAGHMAVENGVRYARHHANARALTEFTKCLSSTPTICAPGNIERLPTVDYTDILKLVMISILPSGKR